MHPKFDEMGTTVGLVICLAKKLLHTGKIVGLDSSFRDRDVELKDWRVFASVVIMQRHYWLKYIDGSSIKAHFINKEVGAVDVMHGFLDGVKVLIFAMKEPDYVMSWISTYGTNEQMGEEKYYKYVHCIDDNNVNRHSPISLKTTRKTKRWECHVFCIFTSWY